MNRLLIVPLASIEAEGLFIQITEQVERLHAHIGTFDSALQQAPIVLNAVSVHVPLHIGFRVINHLVGVFLANLLIAVAIHR